jgi:hypothetical protein
MALSRPYDGHMEAVSIPYGGRVEAIWRPYGGRVEAEANLPISHNKIFLLKLTCSIIS